VTGDWRDEELSRDGFLGGRLTLFQPRKGYRAGNDPVILAAAVPAQSGQSLLDLGCGAGVAALCVARRVPGMNIVGVERQPEYAALARRNAEANGIAMQTVCADLTQLPAALRQRQFDHVIANPPFFRFGAHAPADDAGRAAARGEQTPLADWVGVAAKRLRPRGLFHMIQSVERMPEAICAALPLLGSLEVLPLSARPGRAPERFLLRARKEGRAAFRLWPPLMLHDGPSHDTDRDSYTPEFDAILRDAAPLEWPVGAKR
jgi:tRNA1(Val) A37 N6-methylase TrmN6